MKKSSVKKITYIVLLMIIMTVMTIGLSSKLSIAINNSQNNNDKETKSNINIKTVKTPIHEGSIEKRISKNQVNGNKYDFNTDNVVDINDINLIKDNYATNNKDYDLNDDDKVDLFDLVIISKNITEGDTTKPVFSNIPENVTIEYGESLDLLSIGLTASDNVDGDITESITVDITDTSALDVGEHTVTYTVVDNNKNKSTIQIKLTITYVLNSITEINFNNNENLITWDKVDNATSYELIIDGDKFIVNENKFKYKNVINEIREYSIDIKSIASGDYYIDSEVTNHKHIYTGSSNDQLSIAGKVDGLENGTEATVVLYNDNNLYSSSTNEFNYYVFKDIPEGDYYIKVEVNGYYTEGTKSISVGNFSALSSSNNVNNTKISDFTVTKMDNNHVYHWESDNSFSGYETTAYVNLPLDIEYIGEENINIDSSYEKDLLDDYKIVLSNENVPWTKEYTYRLLETLKTVPNKFNKENKKYIIILSNEHIENDYTIAKQDDVNYVTISKDAFVYANPQIVKIDNVKGKFYSKRLHQFVTRLVTNNGNDINAVEKILKERFDVTTLVPDYKSLTVTDEDSSHFQQFHSEELIYIISMFEEMPEGFHKVNGLKYLLRRLDGHPHPLHPQAPAVAWPSKGVDSYIEFMDEAFYDTSDIAHTYRLIIHEKTHFLWSNVFSDNIKNEWIEIGGWYENPDDPDGWSTTKTTEFVSAYAHKKNPNEDMAESIADFIKNPELLKSRSINKYNFIKDRIMHGTRYISKIRDDLTFEVLNLFPDYDFPGKIKRLDIWVDGESDEDKKVTIEIEINNMDNLFDGASKAYTRVSSEIGTYYDMYMHPINNEKSILRGSFIISKFAKSGYWTVDQIKVTDLVGNQRFEGVDDFGWLLNIDNELEDLEAPVYVENSMNLEIDTEMIEGNEVTVVTATWDFIENVQMRVNSPVYARLINLDNNEQYRIDEYGIINEDGKAEVKFYFPDYMPSGNYGLVYTVMIDQARNKRNIYYSDSNDDEEIRSIVINTNNSDYENPTLDVNNITITAEPTNPDAPNGETVVTIKYLVKDNISGLGQVSYRLRDPQGISHFEYHYHENFYTIFFDGDPTEWKEYTINVTLPIGSPPGIWGLESMELIDKAGNKAEHYFVETLRFDVLDN